MMDLKPRATVIGDVVDSREVADRDVLHARVLAALDLVNTTLAPTTPLRITVGDEYQGVFAGIGDALHAALVLRLELLPVADLRHGIGWGGVGVLQDDPRVEDGPGWWAARDAIEAVVERSGRPGLRALRTWFGRAQTEPGPDPHAVNAALLCRDQLITASDERSIRLLRGLLAGRTQRELAHDEEISESAVSQRTRTGGLAVVLAADAMLREVTS